MLQTVTGKTRKRKPMHWSTHLNKSLERPSNATCWAACHDVLQLLLTPLCQQASKCADQKKWWARGTRLGIHPDQAVSSPCDQSATPCTWNARFESWAQCQCHRWCPTTRLSSIADAHCGLAWAPYVRRAGSSFMVSLASLSFRVLLTLIIALLLSRKRSVSCSLQKSGMMPRAQEGTRQTLKNNFGRSVHSLHPWMRRLRGNAHAMALTSAMLFFLPLCFFMKLC